MKITVNGHEIEAQVIGTDGRPSTEPPTPREHWTLETLDAALMGAAAFRSQYRGATLERAEIMRGVDEVGAGCYYLRYRTAGVPTELWGGLARTRPGLDLKRGQVTVAVGAQTPPG